MVTRLAKLASSRTAEQHMPRFLASATVLLSLLPGCVAKPPVAGPEAQATAAGREKAMAEAEAQKKERREEAREEAHDKQKSELEVLRAKSGMEPAALAERTRLEEEAYARREEARIRREDAAEEAREKADRYREERKLREAEERKREEAEKLRRERDRKPPEERKPDDRDEAEIRREAERERRADERERREEREEQRRKEKCQKYLGKWKLEAAQRVKQEIEDSGIRDVAYKEMQLRVRIEEIGLELHEIYEQLGKDHGPAALAQRATQLESEARRTEHELPEVQNAPPGQFREDEGKAMQEMKEAEDCAKRYGKDKPQPEQRGVKPAGASP